MYSIEDFMQLLFLQKFAMESTTDCPLFAPALEKSWAPGLEMLRVSSFIIFILCLQALSHMHFPLFQFTNKLFSISKAPFSLFVCFFPWLFPWSFSKHPRVLIPAVEQSRRLPLPLEAHHTSANQITTRACLRQVVTAFYTSSVCFLGEAGSALLADCPRVFENDGAAKRIDGSQSHSSTTQGA